MKGVGEMDILLIADKNHPLEPKLTSSLEEAALDQQIYKCSELRELPNFLLRRAANASIALILVGGPSDEQRLLVNRDIIRSIRSLIVLPEHNPDVTERMQALWPRFIGYADTNYDLIVQVAKQAILRAA